MGFLSKTIYEDQIKQTQHSLTITKKKLIMEKKPNAHVLTTSVTQTANEVLGTKEKKLYFLVIETVNGKYQLNVGEKTHDEIQKLTAPRETQTVINVLPPQSGEKRP